MQKEIPSNQLFKMVQIAMALETVVEEDEVSDADVNYNRRKSSINPFQIIRFRKNSDVEKTSVSEFSVSACPEDNYDARSRNRNELVLTTKDLRFGDTVLTPFAIVTHIRNDNIELPYGIISGQKSSTSTCRKSDCTSKSTDVTQSETPSVEQCPCKHVYFVISITIMVLLLTIIATGIFLNWKRSVEMEDLSEFKSPEEWYITRTNWSATQAKSKKILKIPVEYVILGNTNTVEAKTLSKCKKTVKRLQKNHMKQFSDIEYNFLICGNGSWVFEGCGANVVGFHTSGFNQRSIMIAYVGRFNNTNTPPPSFIKRTRQLIHALVVQHKISRNHTVLSKIGLEKGGYH